ncbi:hypothetical protein [Sphingomonas mucosissima]|uniref:Glycosyl transferases group 1 n=1 Tax=Sphingomonas mucosissima TaxID=370959 RepID=A0A245ZLZ8_9SPHN|nr:hypothetical protein [Sphingomonas mucosissima]OWK30755.1 hypothetical protein SPMU_17440 [Sphingomonas mucosissima]
MRKIAIVGLHTALKPGFNAAMSLNEALGFEAHGCDVTLYLPHTEGRNPHAWLRRAGYRTFDDLPRFGGQFDVKPLAGVADLEPADVLIWQSYNARDLPLLPELRRPSMIRTKNVPRAFTGEPGRDSVRVASFLKEFDLVTLSLRADQQIVRAHFPEQKRRLRYVPRGFIAEWLNGNGRGEVPAIGLDLAKSADTGRARRHITKLGQQLRDQWPDLRFLSVREEVDTLGSEGVPTLPLRDYYDRFLNRLWLYMPIDFEHSEHVKGLARTPDGRRMFLGLYENEVVEAQLAGALVLARRDDIPSELLMLPAVSQVESYDDEEALLAAATAHLENFAERSQLSQERARARHNHIEMARAWLAALDVVARDAARA